MKHGPFILITEAEDLLAQDYPGVVSPNGVSLRLISNLKAVIFDNTLSPGQRRILEKTCREGGIPYFYTHVPEAGTEALLQTHLLTFLKEQNEWRNDPPSLETFERIELKTLVDIITTANSLLEPKDVMQTVMVHIHELIPCEAWSVLILDNNQDNTLSFAVVYGPGSESLLDLTVPFGKGIAGWVAEHRKPAIVNNARTDPRFMSSIDENTRFVTRNILCAPLVSRGRTIGVIEMLNSTKEHGFAVKDLELIQVLVNPAAVAIENAYLFQKAQRLTIIDDLTKLYNSRHLSHCLAAEIDKAEQLGHSLALIFLDLDGFKKVNDNYGHLVGSRALIDIGNIIEKVASETDIVGRYGGDEFMLILPGADADLAMERARAIRDAVAEYRMRDLSMTASIGVAIYPLHTNDKEHLIRLADKAMYRVKDEGKNGILFANERDASTTLD